MFGISRGSFAEYAAALEDKLARKPVEPLFEQAAVVPVSAATALQGLTDAGRVEAGQQVLDHRRVRWGWQLRRQLAKAFGAEVTGVCSTAKLDLVWSLGADHVIDYTRDDFADGENRYDLILDIGGNPALSRLRRALTPPGTPSSSAARKAAGGPEASAGRCGPDRVALRVPAADHARHKERGSDRERLTELIEAGKVTPSIDRTYPLDQVPEAMRHLEAGQSEARSRSRSERRSAV